MSLKPRSRCALLLLWALLPLGGRAQELPAPLYIPPFYADVGGNMAAEVAEQVRANLRGVEVGDWGAVVQQFASNRDIDTNAVQQSNCITNRQIAANQGLTLLLCGSITTGSEGFRIMLEVFDLKSGQASLLPPAVARDQSGLVAHATREILRWHRSTFGEAGLLPGGRSNSA